MRHLLLVLAFFVPAQMTLAQEVAPTLEPGGEAETETAPAARPMTLERLDLILRALDDALQTNGQVWQMRIDGVQVLIVTDEAADRMRAMTPVRPAQEMSPEEMERVLQANFDTALDARYAIANEVLWSAFIHPLAALEKDQLISGLGQVVNLAQSYGTLYSGGALQYGGGDSGALQRKLIDDLLKKGEDI